MTSRIDERLQLIRFLQQGQNPEPLLERRLEQEQQRLQETVSQTTSTLQQRQTLVAARVKEIANEMETTPIFSPTELLAEHLQQTLNQVQSTLEKIKAALQSSQNQLDQMHEKKIELTQSLQHVRGELKFAETKPLSYQNELYAANEAVNSYIAKKLSKESS